MKFLQDKYEENWNYIKSFERKTLRLLRVQYENWNAKYFELSFNIVEEVEYGIAYQLTGQEANAYIELLNGRYALLDLDVLTVVVEVFAHSYYARQGLMFLDLNALECGVNPSLFDCYIYNAMPHHMELVRNSLYAKAKGWV